jgi:hypothetical protein
MICFSIHKYLWHKFLNSFYAKVTKQDNTNDYDSIKWQITNLQSHYSIKFKTLLCELITTPRVITP